MDNLTHTLVAVTLARTRLGRAGRGSLAALVVGSNAPDVDVVAILGGPLTYLQWHRGPTHGVLGVAGLGLAAGGALHVWRRSRRPPSVPSDNAPFRALAGLAMLGALIHVLMDIPTPYGTRLLSPFDWRWIATDWFPIVDVYLLAILGSALAFGHARSARHRNAVMALVLLPLYYGMRVVSHDRALAAAPLVFGPRLPSPCVGTNPGARLASWPVAGAMPDAPGGSRCLIDLAAIPTLGSPFTWRVIAQTSSGYDLQTISVLDPRIRDEARRPAALWRLTRHVSNVWPPAAHEAASTRTARVFLGFSRFPAARVNSARDGSTSVHWTDLRYVAPDPPRDQGRTVDRRGLFSMTVQLDASGRIVDERLGP